MGSSSNTKLGSCQNESETPKLHHIARYIYNIPGAPIKTPLLKVNPPKTRPNFQSKQGCPIWVAGTLGCSPPPSLPVTVENEATGWGEQFKLVPDSCPPMWMDTWIIRNLYMSYVYIISLYTHEICIIYLSIHFPTCFLRQTFQGLPKKNTTTFIKATTAKASRSQSLVSNPPAM